MIDKKYLPSEKFVIKIVIIVIGITLIFGIYELSKFIIKGFTKEKGSKSLLISELIEKDSNNNGIADWEESLWGLDPKKDGSKNKEIILSKKNLLSPDDIANKNKSITDNEMLAREFFAVISYLQQTGEIDESGLGEISKSVAETIETEPIPDIYTIDMLKTVPDSAISKNDYINKFKKLALKYESEDLGKELIFISQGIMNQDQQAMYIAKTVAMSYISFSNEITEIPTPESMTYTTIELANNLYKNGLAIEGLSKTLEDPIVGMRSIINYKKYSDAVTEGIKNLSSFVR